MRVRGAGGLKVGGGGGSQGRRAALKKKTREDVKGHSQLGRQMGDFVFFRLCLFLFVPCN